MYSRVNYTIVGLFVLIFGTGLVLFFFWLAKFGIHDEYKTYKTYMTESVSGLSKDSTVKLHGVDVGRVSAIRIDPNNIERVEIDMDIKADVPIKEDMVVHTKMMGITGLLAVEIDGGSNAAKTLTANKGVVPVLPSKPSWMAETTKGLGELSSNIVDLVARSKKILSDENIDNFTKTMAHVEKVTANAEILEAKTIESLKKFDVSLVEYNTSVAQIAHDFRSMKRAFVPAIDNFHKTSSHFNRLTVKVEKSLDRGDYDFKTILDPMMVEINILSDEINDIAQEYKNSPSDILFKSRKSRRGPGE